MSTNRNVPWYVADREKPAWKDRLILAQAALVLLFLGALIAWLSDDHDLGGSLLIVALFAGQEVCHWTGKRDGWRAAVAKASDA